MRARSFSAAPSATGLLLLLLLASLACAWGTAPATTSPPSPAPFAQATATPLPLRGTPLVLPASAARAERFAPYTTIPEREGNGEESFSRYRLHLGKVDNPEALSLLNQAQQDALLANGFVVVPTAYASFNDLYRDPAAQNLPLFITIDAAAHALDTVKDVAWLRAQKHYLAADLAALSEALVSESLTQWETAPDETVAEAAWRNLAFFAIGHRLQDPGAEVPAPVADVVRDEVTLIEEGGTFLSPLFDTSEDYGRFRPSGPYAANPLLDGYYRALTWYAHPFSLADDTPSATRLVARQLLLLARAVHSSQNDSRWQRLYRSLAYFEGTAGDGNIETVARAAELLYGEMPAPTASVDPDTLDNFIATLQAYPSPVTLAPSAPPAFRFLPARVSPDRLWLDTFVFNRVGGYTGAENTTPLTLIETAVGPVRGLPRVLDLAAAQGSAVAAEQLEGNGDTAFTGYDSQIETARVHLAALDEAAWTQTWTAGWYYGLQPLLHTPPALPFTRSRAWETKALNSWYGSWVRLQATTTLAARPVAPQVPVSEYAGYVEPYPTVYGRLAALARQTYTGLAQYNLMEEEAGEKLLELERLLLAWQTIAVKELSAQPLTADERLLLRQAGARLENLLTFAPDDGNVPLTARTAAQIVDVYPSPGGDELLQAGVGGIWPMYVLVPAQERLLLTVGGVFSTYELRVTREERWAPEESVSLPEEVEPAAWTGAFLLPSMENRSR